MSAHHPVSLVSCQWLKEEIARGLPDDVVICDVSWSSTVDMKIEYDRCHIPGAVHLKVLDEEEFSELLPRNKPTIDKFQLTAREAGINNDDHVIVYSNSDINGYYMSGRAWWTLKMFGHNRVSILDGGIKKWLKEEFQTVDHPPKIKLGNFTVNFTDRYIRGFDQMHEMVKLNSIQICDSRASCKFSGPESKGHIKNAKNIPLQSLMNNEDGTLKSVQDIQKEFSAAKVDLNKPVITYCFSGMSSCSLTFISLMCGCPDASVYMGGFTEWSKRADDHLVEKH